MEQTLSGRSILFVHAHPDDESCSTGGAIALAVEAGAHVCVVTCTRGDEGRIAPPELQHLHADADDALGPCRAGELRCAMNALGVTDHRFLIGEGHYRDSGRMGKASNERPDAFWQADVDEAGAWLAEVICEVRPDAVVTYDPNGGYGHPDHIQTHRVTHRAVELAAQSDDAFSVPAVYWCAVPRERIRQELLDLEAEVERYPGMWVETEPEEYPDGVHDDAEISVTLDVSSVWGKKRAALACHRTQLTVVDDCWVLASGRGMRIQPTEWFIRVSGEGSETSLFGEID